MAGLATLALLLFTSTTPDDALRDYRRAIEFQESLVRGNPQLVAYRSHLAVSHFGLGNRQREANLRVVKTISRVS